MQEYDFVYTLIVMWVCVALLLVLAWAIRRFPVLRQRLQRIGLTAELGDGQLICRHKLVLSRQTTVYWLAINGQEYLMAESAGQASWQPLVAKNDFLATPATTSEQVQVER